MKPLIILPSDFIMKWQARLVPATIHPNGSFRLVHIRKTKPKTWEEGRLIVRLIDENNIPIGSETIAFAYDTAPDMIDLAQDWVWPPPEYRADLPTTRGSGEVEHIQGSVISEGGKGGITVFVANSQIPSDYIEGMGALHDHTGAYMTFQLQRPGVLPLDEWKLSVEYRLEQLESA